MKKLNRKGFTLIELLAVIVIMAIILIVTVPNIINSISDARVSSIHNLAVSVANTYDNAYAQDLLATNKTLGNIPESMRTTWQCIGDLKSSTAYNTRELAEILGLTSVDVVLTGDEPAETLDENALKGVTTSTCSAIRMKNGNAEVLLVAANGGRFYVAQKHTYALSTMPIAGQNDIVVSE